MNTPFLQDTAHQHGACLLVFVSEKPFDSRPSDAERQEATRDEPATGVLDCRLPARTLFADYERLAREMTWDYYVANFGAGLLKTALSRVHLPAAAT